MLNVVDKEFIKHMEKSRRKQFGKDRTILHMPYASEM